MHTTLTPPPRTRCEAINPRDPLLGIVCGDPAVGMLTFKDYQRTMAVCDDCLTHFIASGRRIIFENFGKGNP